MKFNQNPFVYLFSVFFALFLLNHCAQTINLIDRIQIADEENTGILSIEQISQGTLEADYTGYYDKEGNHYRLSFEFNFPCQSLVVDYRDYLYIETRLNSITSYNGDIIKDGTHCTGKYEAGIQYDELLHFTQADEFSVYVMGLEEGGMQKIVFFYQTLSTEALRGLSQFISDQESVTH